MNSVQVNFNEKTLSVPIGQSLLDSVLSQGGTLAHSCRSGICQNCLIKIEEGTAPAASQKGLSENQKQQNLALACQLKPDEFLSVTDKLLVKRVNASVVGHEKLNPSVLKLQLLAPVEWFPGQFLTIWKNEELGRPYSIASLPNENILEFHIKVHEKGEVSNWLVEEINIGDEFEVSPPIGNCFYNTSMGDKPLVLIGVGTGLAPLWGIIRDALNQEHPKPITLYVAFKDIENSYYFNELKTLEDRSELFTFEYILRDEEMEGALKGDIVDIVKEKVKDFKNTCVFLCGIPEPIKQLQKFCFLQGASMSDIYCDPFASPR